MVQGIQGMQAESRVTVRGRPTLSGWQAYCQLWEQDHRLSLTGSLAADGGCCGFAPGPEAPWCWLIEPLIGNLGKRGPHSRHHVLTATITCSGPKQLCWCYLCHFSAHPVTTQVALEPGWLVHRNAVHSRYILPICLVVQSQAT